MTTPDNMANKVGDQLRKGIGFFSQGVDAMSDVLRSTDSAVKEVDGALTGRRPATEPEGNPTTMSDEQAAERVNSLIRQGSQEARQSQNPQSPLVVNPFKEAMQLLLQMRLPNSIAGLADMLPSPADAVKTGLRDLRGSMALLHLANGTGSLSDVEEVASFVDNLAGRAQTIANTVTQPVKSAEVTSPPNNPNPQPTSRRAPRGGRRQLKQPASDEAVAFARAIGQAMGEDRVLKAAQGMEDGTVSEKQFLDRWSRMVATGKFGRPDELIERARQSSGLSTGTAILENAAGLALRRASEPPPFTPKESDAPGTVFAHAIAQEMGNPDVTKWANELAAGGITEEDFISRLGGVPSELDPDELFRRAKNRAIAMGVPADDPVIASL